MNVGGFLMAPKSLLHGVPLPAMTQEALQHGDRFLHVRPLGPGQQPGDRSAWVCGYFRCVSAR